MKFLKLILLFSLFLNNFNVLYASNGSESSNKENQEFSSALTFHSTTTSEGEQSFLKLENLERIVEVVGNFKKLFSRIESVKNTFEATLTTLSDNDVAWYQAKLLSVDDEFEFMKKMLNYPLLLEAQKLTHQFLHHDDDVVNKTVEEACATILKFRGAGRRKDLIEEKFKTINSTMDTLENQFSPPKNNPE